jgi:dihydroorotase
MAGMNSGLVDAIATDHAPHAIEDKLCEFDLAAFGISCFDTALGTLMTQVERGELRLERVIAALTTGPAGAFRIGDRISGAGTLTPGAASDLVVFDPLERWTVDTARFASKGKNSPLKGTELLGRVRAVVIGGGVVHSAEVAHA